MGPDLRGVAFGEVGNLFEEEIDVDIKVLSSKMKISNRWMNLSLSRRTLGSLRASGWVSYNMSDTMYG